MKGFDFFRVGSSPTFLSLGNERVGVPLYPLYHSGPFEFQAHFLYFLGMGEGLHMRWGSWCVIGTGIVLGVGSFFRGDV